jgi:hypothetical protein
VPRHWPLAPEPEPVFGLLEVAFVAGFLLVVILLCGFAAIFIAHHVPALRGIRTQELANDPRVLLPAQFGAYFLLLAVLWRLFSGYHHIGLLRALNWSWPVRWPRFLAVGVLLAVVVQLTSTLMPSPPELPIDEMMHTPLDAWLMSGFGVLFAPFVEEIFFRGLLFPALARHTGTLISLAITSAAFGAVHSAQLGWAWSQVALIVLVGIVLTSIRWRFHSLASSTLVHMGYNGALFAALFIQTKGFTHLTGR